MITGNLTKVGAKGLGGEIPGKVYIGIQGPPGKTPELSVGDVETLPPESPATVEITGTKEKPILNFGIPQGKKGDGPGGNVDLTGYATEEWVEKGYQPKGNYLTKVPDGYAKTEDIPKKPEDIGALPSTYTPPNQTAEQVGADPKGTAAGAVSQHNTDETAHNDLRLELKRVADRLAEFLDSDDEKLDQLSELIAGISSNKTLIEAVTTGKVSVTDIIDNLTTNAANKPLSAAQGVVLKGLIDNVSKSLSNYQPKGDYALRSEIPAVPVKSVNGKTGAVQLSAADVGARPSDWVPTAADVGALPSTYTPPNQTAEQVGADPKGAATAAVSQHNTADDSHGDIRLELEAIKNRLNAFFDSDNQTLDELSEIVAYITSNKSLIDSITTSKVSVADIINNLTSNVANKPLSAAQGVVLKGLIDTVSKSLASYALKSEIPTKVSQLQNDSGYLTQHQDISGLLPRTELPTAINTALAQAKQSGEFNGKDGTSVTVKKVTESTEDGGSNVVEFSDGKTIVIKNGRKGNPGYTPQKNVDYWTPADQEEIVQQVITALGTPVYGKVDLGKKITLSTEHLADGNYEVGYEDKDGNWVLIGTLNAEGEPTYTNVLPLAINSDGTPFVGANGEKGYKTNTRLSSSGAESTSNATGMEVTGFIPVAFQDSLYFKDVEVIKQGTNSDKCYFTVYNSSFAKIADRRMDGTGADGAFTWDENNNIKSLYLNNNGGFSANIDNAAYLRFSATEINASSIITKNEPIE
jgi:hypothetical protein